MEPTILAARTTVVIPFQWHDAGGVTPAIVEDDLQALRWTVAGHAVAPWTAIPGDALGSQVRELAPAVRHFLGHPKPADPLATRTLRLSGGALRLLFGDDARLRFLRVADHQSQAVGTAQLREVRLHVFPLGAGALVLQLAWIDPGSVEELASALNAARTLHQDVRYVGFGVLRGGAPGLRDDLERVLGSPEAAAWLGEKPVRLGAWAESLLRASLAQEGRFLGPSRRCYLQSAVVLDQAPAQAALEEALPRLARGDDARHRACRDVDGCVTLRARTNRAVMVTREGSVAVNWPEEGANRAFEVDNWPARFAAQTYLSLALVSIAEDQVLARLALDAARVAPALVTAEPGRNERRRRAAVRALRETLGPLARRMVQYTLVMTADDCGGLTEYASFHEALRRTRSIPERRAELRAELEELTNVTEATHAEVGEIQRDAEARIERAAIVLGIVTLPVLVVTALFSTNGAPDPGPSLSELALASLVITVALFGALFAWSAWMKRRHQ